MLKPFHNLLLAFCLTVFAGSFAKGQTISSSAIASQGETYKTSQITLSYIIGEAIGDVLMNGNANKYLTTGFIQPDVEVSQVLAGVAKSLAIYPNPTNGGIVKLAFNHVPDGTYNVNIYDANGKVLQSQKVNYSSSDFYYLPLDVSDYAGGTYFIQVVNPYKFSGEVKLIKY